MNKYHGTVKDFLEAGHRFVEGDVYTELKGSFDEVANINKANELQDGDDKRYVVYAACLNKEPEPEYDLVNCWFNSVFDAIDSIRNDRNQKFYNCEGRELVACEAYSHVSIVYADSGQPIGYKDVYRRTPLRTKTATYPMPETKAPEYGTEYFVSTTSTPNRYIWAGTSKNFEYLRAGVVFLKREHAQAKTDAQAVEV